MCKCNNFGCKIRTERGLKPFCEMTAADVMPRVRGFHTYGEAVAARKDGQKVVSAGQYLNGGRREFFLVAT